VEHRISCPQLWRAPNGALLITPVRDELRVEGKGGAELVGSEDLHNSHPLLLLPIP